MKATEFAKFFEFTIQFATDFDEYGNEAKYEVIDDQGVFHTRYINKIEELIDCFDSMLDDYIFSIFEEDGYKFNEHENYFKQLEKWTQDKKEYEGIREIILCFIYPELIEEDLGINKIDKELEKRWEEMEDISFDEINGELVLSNNYYIFNKGTTRENI